MQQLIPLRTALISLTAVEHFQRRQSITSRETTATYLTVQLIAVKESNLMETDFKVEFAATD